MATLEKPLAIPTEDLAELAKTIEDMVKGVRDPDAMDQAAQDLDEGREEIRKRFGLLDLAVELTEPDDE